MKMLAAIAGTLAVAGIVGGIVLGNRVSANEVSIQRNCDDTRGLGRRLEKIEDGVHEILIELRK
jgi:hypothetical protein